MKEKISLKKGSDAWRPEYGWRPEEHPRQADIDRGQKPMMTPNYRGVGCRGRSWGGKEGLL